MQNKSPELRDNGKNAYTANYKDQLDNFIKEECSLAANKKKVRKIQEISMNYSIIIFYFYFFDYFIILLFYYFYFFFNYFTIFFYFILFFIFFYFFYLRIFLEFSNYKLACSMG